MVLWFSLFSVGSKMVLPGGGGVVDGEEAP